ncbi:MAG: hypothetical protein RLY70_4346 [Planctomycetota bacterium]|jgi:hypothetical protein
MMSTFNLTRRETFQLAAAGVSAVSCSGWLGSLAAHAAETPAKKQKSCILLWMDGGPSQTDTFDPKPDAPQEYRGTFQTIATSVPGLQIAEGYSKVSQLMQHACVIRGMSTTEAAEHWRARIYMHTSYRPNFAGLSYPSFGSIVSSLRPQGTGLPNFMVTGKTMEGGGFPYIAGGGYLGPRHSGLILRDLTKGLEHSSPPVDATEFAARMSLADRLAAGFQRATPISAVAAQRSAYQGAVELMRSPKGKVFDLTQEPAEAHDRYGKHYFGQGCLLARRLIETGVPFVEVYLGDWDTHEQRRADMVRNECLPASDQAMHALITDLKDRGLLDDTLIIWMGEFGRTPKTHHASGARNHYDKAWSTVFFGGGVPGGSIIGKTDQHAAEVVDRPVSGPDFMATVLKLLGIDPGLELHAGNRPVRAVAPGGKPIEEITG